MTFDRDLLPAAVDYFESQGVQFREKKTTGWRTTGCQFHGSADSMRMHMGSGAWVCMSGCGARGGDVLAYHMAAHGLDFITAAKQLGAWVEDGKPFAHRRPAPFSARAALEVLADDVMLVAVAAGNVAMGVELSDRDRGNLMRAAGRIRKIAEVAA